MDGLGLVEAAEVMTLAGGCSEELESRSCARSTSFTRRAPISLWRLCCRAAFPHALSLSLSLGVPSPHKLGRQAGRARPVDRPQTAGVIVRPWRISRWTGWHTSSRFVRSRITRTHTANRDSRLYRKAPKASWETRRRWAEAHLPARQLVGSFFPAGPPPPMQSPGGRRAPGTALYAARSVR